MIRVELTYDMGTALGERWLELEGAATVGDALRQVRERFASKAADFEAIGARAAIAVNGVMIKSLQNTKTRLADGDTVTFFKAVAGG